MKYQELENNKFIVEFDSKDEKENFIKYFTDLTTVSSKQIEAMGISRQLLRYWVNKGYVRTVPHCKQKKYLLDDIKKQIERLN